ncbi:type II 3-dehydroquinate dehydratase [Idiomarina seosinensis]|uniref:type II 3-dehydroquinate dehydratase n=1 Tax=Idiomarina seosinensis TaxID=281739 RepID=UPI00384DE251
MNTKEAEKTKVLVINGPNLNLLGTREPEVYGSQTLVDVQQQLISLSQPYNLEVDFVQSNAEAELIEAIHEARNAVDFIIINPAAYAHTSIALRDALAAVSIPFFEVHISNIYRREKFRHFSYLADIASATLSGFGTYGYSLAMLAIINQLPRN